MKKSFCIASSKTLILAASAFFAVNTASASAASAPVEDFDTCYDLCIENGTMDSAQECRVRCEYRSTPQPGSPPPTNGGQNGGGENGGGRGEDGGTGTGEGTVGQKCGSVSWAPPGIDGTCHPTGYY